jgi:tetratricopeptide (TPR) repeat protein
MDAKDASLDRPALMKSIEEAFRDGHFMQAHKDLDQALAAEPDDVPLLMLRALAQSKLALWEGAQKDFAKARALDPEDPEAWLGEGICLAMRQDVYPALDLLEEILQRQPAFVRGHIQIARYYYKLCVSGKGKAHLQAALAADPSLDERREIDALLKGEALLDQKRMYRPDFEALRREKAARAGA